MIVDAYKDCPCGSGKKIKFCCSADIVNDLDKVVRAMAGDQRRSALDQVERLIASKGPRPALLVLQAGLQFTLKDFDGHRATVAQLLSLAPESAVGRAFSAVLKASEGELSEGVDELQRALDGCEQTLHESVFDAMGVLGRTLLQTGYLLAGRAHLMLQLAAGREDQAVAAEISEILRSFNANPRIPTLFKDPPPLCSCPEGFAQSEAFEKATQLGNQGHWLAASEKFVALAQVHPNEPILMRNIAILCGCLGNHPMAIGAWRKYASLPKVEADDAIDAEAMALLLEGIYDADPLDEVVVTFEIDPFDRVSELISSTREFTRLSVDPEMYAVENEPPPRMVFQLLDGPAPTDAAPAVEGSYPQVQGIVLLFGKETNRPARVIFETRRDDRFARNMERLRGLLQPHLQKVQEEVAGQIGLLNYLWSRQLYKPRSPLEPNFRAALNQLPSQLFEKELASRPLSALGGKTLREAASDPAASRTAQALILLMELQADTLDWDFDFDAYRRSLGLPVPPPLEATLLKSRPAIGLSCTKWRRIALAEMSDEQVSGLMGFAAAIHLTKSAVSYAREIERRPSTVGALPRIGAHQLLADAAENPDEALQHITAACDQIVAQKRSPARYLLTTLVPLLQRGFAEVFTRVFERIQRNYMSEPGIAQSLYQLLISMGVMTPDGKLVEQPGTAPAAETPAAGGIWTPEGAAASPASESKSKLWVPGMD